MAQQSREPRTFGKESHLLYHPARAMRMAFLLGHHPPLAIALSMRDRHGFAAHATRPHQIADFGLRLTTLYRALDVLAPENPLAAACQNLRVIGSIPFCAKLIIRGAVIFQATDQQLPAAARIELAPARGRRT